MDTFEFVDYVVVFSVSGVVNVVKVSDLDEVRYIAENEDNEILGVLPWRHI